MKYSINKDSAIEEGRYIDKDGASSKDIVLKLYIHKKEKSKTDYIFDVRIPACDQMNYPGYTKRLALPYHLEIESYNDNISTVYDTLLSESQKAVKINNTLMHADVLKKGNVDNSDVEWMFAEMKKIVNEVDGRRDKLSDALSDNPYKPPRTAVQIVNCESSKRYVRPKDNKPKLLDIRDGENPIVSLVKTICIMVMGVISIPIMLAGFLLGFIYDSCINLFYGRHKVTFQEKNWFEEAHRKLKDCDTESIDKYIYDEIVKIVARLHSRYPSLDVQPLLSSGNDSDEFIIAFAGKRKSEQEFQEERLAARKGDVSGIVSGAVVSVFL
jgi:hypothetical protein